MIIVHCFLNCSNFLLKYPVNVATDVASDVSFSTNPLKDDRSLCLFIISVTSLHCQYLLEASVPGQRVTPLIRSIFSPRRSERCLQPRRHHGLHDGWTTDDASTAWRSYLPQPVRTLSRRVLRTPSVRYSIARHNDYGHRNMQLLNVIILCTKCKCSAPVFSLREGLV
ncbi:hypothetical protein WA026_023152 [Henosepilachna vigintioctopunctata]|uniref:Uncharacterized protein n=1 Tax=Henosepilachna vigintioctopunctata TaxID=420089 RepID=A0AAW1TTD7_9CUCU